MAGDDDRPEGGPEAATRRRRRVVLVVGDPSATTDAVSLDEPGALHALADPIRLKIVRLLAEPATAKEVAEALDRPVTSLYHHLDVLTEHGVIEVADIQKEGRHLIRRYVRAGDRFTAAPELDDLLRDLDGVWVRRDAAMSKQIVRAVRAALGKAGRDEPRLRMLIRGAIDPDRLDELGRRLRATIAEFAANKSGETGELFEVAITISPARAAEDDKDERS